MFFGLWFKHWPSGSHKRPLVMEYCSHMSITSIFLKRQLIHIDSIELLDHRVFSNLSKNSCCPRKPWFSFCPIAGRCWNLKEDCYKMYKIAEEYCSCPFVISMNNHRFRFVHHIESIPLFRLSMILPPQKWCQLPDVWCQSAAKFASLFSAQLFGLPAEGCSHP